MFGGAYHLWMGLYKRINANWKRDCTLTCRYVDEVERWDMFDILEARNRYVSCCCSCSY